MTAQQVTPPKASKHDNELCAKPRGTDSPVLVPSGAFEDSPAPKSSLPMFGGVQAWSKEEDTSNFQMGNATIPQLAVPCVQPQTNTFLTRPIPMDQVQRFNVVREKQWRGYPVFKVYNTDDKQLIMAARKRKKSMTANYIIATEADQLHRDSPSIIGKVRATDMKPVGGGQLFTVYDGGQRPGMLGEGPPPECLRHELAFVEFGPASASRSCFSLVLPTLDAEGNMAIIKPLEPCVFSDLELMRNKALDTGNWEELTPMRTIDGEKSRLDFQERAPLESHKNVQVILEQQGRRQTLQFGKLSKDEFSMDVQSPLSPVQAFGLFLATIEHGSS